MWMFFYQLGTIRGFCGMICMEELPWKITVSLFSAKYSGRKVAYF